ncbi:S8 family serine peptidase [Phycisphaerales bacterium AB-hyl4]|uniref:S8 family serine peptidase n=1 Tax=Natronomicrosphaera hydrolytica TaxID=3242702 RepID=A0ABV4U8H0_9BACT
MVRFVLALAVVVLTANFCSGSSLPFNDPLHEQQWYLRAMRFDAAWAALEARDVARKPVVVAVVDSGFDLDHPDLAENMLPGFNIVDGSDVVDALTSHGTGTAGPIGAISNNALGISQAAWTAQVMPIRVTNREDGRARTADINAAIRHAADAGAQVINVSYGGVQLDSVNAAARYAQERGAVVIMPAGNEGRYQGDWKRQPSVLAVGAIGRNGQRASFSNHGSFVDFVAPGQGVTSLYPNQGYARWNGTSFASPLVASAAALVVAANPELTPMQVAEVLRQAVVVDGDQMEADMLPGVIDAARAVELAVAIAEGVMDAPAVAMADATASAGGVDEARWQTHAAAREAELLQSPQGYVTHIYSTRAQ